MTKDQKYIKSVCVRAGFPSDDFFRQVFYNVQTSGLDFSECTERQFRATVRDCVELAKYSACSGAVK